ncbi:auxin transport protein BIG [Tanacetum coccineum]
MLESIDPSKQIAIIEHYLYILGHLESIDPSICISWKLSSSALEMLVPGHAVGNVMGRGRANVDNIRKLRGTEVTLKGLKRKDAQLLRKFKIQFKGASKM